MEGATKQTLRFAEDLTLPTEQVIVMTANMGCSHCRGRVSQVVSKMNAGLLDYAVDLRKKEVVVRGAVDLKERKNKSRRQPSSHTGREKSSASFNPFRLFLCSSGM
uniref:Copper chaperone CopZ n=1 Tax=Anthurium amnicola TaxID=1678845 RepID=A0A1D1XH38_9ARAE